MERRNSFRLKTDAPLYLYLDNQTVEIVDISAGGVSFRFPKISQGKLLDIEIDLHNQTFNCKVEVLSVRDGNLCCCNFIDLTEKEVDRLHKFIIEEQKVIIRDIH